MRSVTTPATFGTFEGQPVFEATITSDSGAIARILNWGATIRDLQVPLAGQGLQRVVLGFDRFEDYPLRSPYFGALVGRYANRIANGRFSLDGRVHETDRNEGGRQTLHGGSKGVSQRLWTMVDWTPASVSLALDLADGDQGFPGNMQVRCTYAFTAADVLTLTVEATCDMPTVVNFAQHSYFNLDGSADVRGHSLQIEADQYTPVDEHLIPTGELVPVCGTEFDFRAARPIGQEGSYDHNFVLRPGKAGTLRPAALLAGNNGLAMQVSTTEPGLQFYNGSMIGDLTGLSGKSYQAYSGICLEAQRFPDGPNQPGFPDSRLIPGEIYRQMTEFRFLQR